MKRRPLLLLLAAGSFGYFPFMLLTRAIQGANVRPVEWVLDFVLPLILIISLVRVSRVGWYTLIGFIALLGIRDLREYYGTSARGVASLATHLAIYIVSIAYFIHPRVRRLYFDPKQHWWKTKPRFDTHAAALCRFSSGNWTYPVLRNLSAGGCFLETSVAPSTGEIVEVRIPVPFNADVSVLQSRGEVRWVSRKADRIGYGVKFIDMPVANRRTLRRYLSVL